MKEISLTNSDLKVLVDDEDFDRLVIHSWYFRDNYAARSYWIPKHRTIFIHSEIMNFPTGYEVDHINHNGLDNRRENLRLCTHSQNAKNSKLPINNTSGYKGACYRKDIKKWHSYITVDGNRLFLGFYNELIDAAKAYDRAAKLHYGEFANLNIKEDK